MQNEKTPKIETKVKPFIILIDEEIAAILDGGKPSDAAVAKLANLLTVREHLERYGTP